jgi:type II secretory pathway component GspD/PulD (secretin)
MRIISSDGMKSINFDQYKLCIDKYVEDNYIIIAQHLKDSIVMSDYGNNIENVKREFGNIHEAYLKGAKVYRIQHKETIGRIDNED